MKQVVQPIGGGPVSVLDVPRPSIGPTEVLVLTQASIISPGTERAVTALAQSSLLSKARARPDLVRQVLKKARTEGVGSTMQAVRAKLASDLPLGYSASGLAVEVGDAVKGVRPGQLVATGGAAKANHAEWQAVPGLLCAAVPEGVPAADAAFTTIASIALHGLRLAEVGPGSKVVVIGLGLIGQLASRLALASGCDVAGIDVSAEPLRVARESGVLALKEQGEVTTEKIHAWSRGRGADAVLLCAAGSSSAVALRAPALCRDRARVVVVGDVGLELSRTPFYEKELSLLFARSYGPGRYEREYEDYGVDYPAGQVRWTEGRNFEAVLDLLAAKRLRVDDLITHRFAVEDARSAYDLIESRQEPYLAVALVYPATQPEKEPPVQVSPRRSAGGRRVGWIGAGAYSSAVLLPAFADAGFTEFASVVSASGLTARRMAERYQFETAASSGEDVIADPSIDVVTIATLHESHAAYTEKALQAGKHVWCEKPVALTYEELDLVEAAWRAAGSALFIGLNRRWAPHVRTVRAALGGAPASVNYRVSAGSLPPRHWYSDRRQGGRLLGEVCHFVDACAAVVDSDVVSVEALGSGADELLLADDYSIVLSHQNGSLSTITYASAGSANTAKERVEVLGGGHTWVINDFRSLSMDGKEQRSDGQDKGQRAAAAAFYAATGGGPDETSHMLSSSRATLALAAALGM